METLTRNTVQTISWISRKGPDHLRTEKFTRKASISIMQDTLNKFHPENNKAPHMSFILAML